MRAMTARTASSIECDARFELTATPSAAAQARGLVEATFSGWAFRHLISDGQLVTSELVSNAITATPGSVIWLLLAHERGAVWIYVWDSSPVLPEKRACKPHSESGRGLHIVAAVSDDNGAFPVADPKGKITWARLKIQTRWCTPPESPPAISW